MSLYSIYPVPITVQATNCVFEGCYSDFVNSPTQLDAKVKICYVSPKCNASKLHEGYEWYEYVGYVEACLIKYSNTVHGNFNAKCCRMEMSPINYIF